MSRAPLVVADNLSYAYGRRTALAEVSFSLAAGDVMGLLGPNGAGKSTCLRLLTGYLIPRGGSVRIDGFDVHDHYQGADARARLGYAAEDATLYPYLSVRECLNLFGRLKGLRGAALASQCEHVIERLALGAVRELAIAKLSRGYRQRVNLAQALLGAPPFVILDEPTNGLDPWQVMELRQSIAGLASTHAVLVTSHVLGEIERIAQRVLILTQGRSRGIYAVDPNAPGALERLFLELTTPT
jgi:ABC-2 type transport system ATP-binding protein